MNASGYAQRLQARQSRFVRRWLSRLQTTRQALVALQADPEQPTLLALINKDFHQLAGASGIYELKLLCTLAIAAEDLLNGQLRGQDAVSEAFLGRIEELLAGSQNILEGLPCEHDAEADKQAEHDIATSS